MWEGKVFAAAVADADADAAAAETDWKHKVTPEWGDLMKEALVLWFCIVGNLMCFNSVLYHG